MDNDRKWHLAWAELQAFKKNLPASITESHVTEFHRCLDLLHEATGEDVSPFRIPDENLKPHVARLRPASLRHPLAVTPSKEKYCDRNVMVRKLDAVCTYFKNIQAPPPEKPKYGF
jgi:hypothetical protein